MKKLITLMASLLLLTACGGSGSGEASTPAGDSSAPAQSSAQQDEHNLENDKYRPKHLPY